jgi:PAS domain S-box-containing protein
VESRPGHPRERLVVGLGVALTAIIFAVDAEMPLGVATGMAYVLVILLGLWVRSPVYPVAAAGAATALLVVDTVMDWYELAPGSIFVNRPLMTLIFWITAILVLRFGRLERRSRRQVKQLADLKYALDQAAIVATTDVTGKITYVNSKFVEISKYDVEELIGQDHRLINSGYHPKEFIRDLWRTIAQGRVWHGEIRNRAKDGSYYWVDTTIVPFLDEHGKPYQYTAIRSDITERKRAEERLREQAALARVGQMAAVVAHEVKNPLAGIKGAMQVIMARRPPADPEVAVMRDIVSRVDQLNELISDLMLFARPRPPHLGPVPLRGALVEAAELIRRDPAGARVEVHVEGDDVTAPGDAQLLKALFMNLMLNSAQAMQGSGRIDAVVSCGADRCRIEIRDRGPGVPEAIRAEIFEPFFTTKSRGGGLGLAIARRTAEMHGGSLTLSCPPGGGTVMTVELPLRPVATVDRPPAPPAPPSPREAARSSAPNPA